MWSMFLVRNIDIISMSAGDIDPPLIYSTRYTWCIMDLWLIHFFLVWLEYPFKYCMTPLFVYNRCLRAVTVALCISFKTWEKVKQNACSKRKLKNNIDVTVCTFWVIMKYHKWLSKRVPLSIISTEYRYRDYRRYFGVTTVSISATAILTHL